MTMCLSAVFCSLCRAVDWSLHFANSIKWSRIQFIWKTLYCLKLVPNFCVSERDEKDVTGSEFTKGLVDGYGRLKEMERLCHCCHLADRRALVKRGQSSAFLLSHRLLTSAHKRSVGP